MNLTTSIDTSIINFNCPNHLKLHLDRLVRFKGISRTSVLLKLIEDYVRSEECKLEQDSRIHQLMSQLETKYHQSILKLSQKDIRTTSDPQPKKKPNPSWEDSYEYDEPIQPIFSSDFYR